MTSARLFGIACTLGAVTLFTIQDATIKWLSDVFPLHEIVLVRAAVAGGLMMVFISFEGGLRLLRTSHPGLHLIRGIMQVITNSAFFAAIAVMPLADAMALFFIAPLIMTALSTVFLREKVGLRRWSAVVVGLLGVIIMLRPGKGSLQVVALLPILAATAYAVLQMLTRRLGAFDRASVMSFYIHVAFIVVGGTMWLLFGDGSFAVSDNSSVQFLLRAWIVPDGRQWTILLVMGVISAFGAYLITQAYRVAEVTVVAPFEYVALPFAMLWGLLVFGDVPDRQAVVGMFLIVASGLYVIYREAALKRVGRDTSP